MLSTLVRPSKEKEDGSNRDQQQSIQEMYVRPDVQSFNSLSAWRSAT